jgi:hypothetical protein
MIHIQLHKSLRPFLQFSPSRTPRLKNFVPLFIREAKEKKVFFDYLYLYIIYDFSRAIYLKKPSLPSLVYFILILQYVRAKVFAFSVPSLFCVYLRFLIVQVNYMVFLMEFAFAFKVTTFAFGIVTFALPSLLCALI